ncbi:MAG: hypothetical protein HY278_00940 [candidate division NC10 bacterium]|nr:hypothetical protein [candidate division NC10 bacterium]
MVTSRGKRLLVGVIVSVMCLAPAAFACEVAGPDTHVGRIQAIDVAKPSLTIIDQQMKKPVTFLAAPEQLKGLSLGQMVTVRYSETKGQLKAEEITPL